MRDRIETRFNVPLYSSGASYEFSEYIPKGSMTPSLGSESVGRVFEYWFIDSFKNHTHNLLDQLVSRVPNCKRTGFTISFWDKDSPSWGELELSCS